MRHANSPQGHEVLSANQWEFYNRHLLGSQSFVRWCNKRNINEKQMFDEWTGWYKAFVRRHPNECTQMATFTKPFKIIRGFEER
ncbi:hypothetical protein KAR91_50255 [Candidatus Pacearchaeota archaeon]|nr:hypothetical protein [Candidatus Pacearchaeota archaeon]